MKRQHELLFKELDQRGFGWIFTKPNNNSYLYLKMLLGFSDISELHAYAFPVRPFRLITPWLAWLDYPWLLLVMLAALVANPLRRFRPASLDELVPEVAADEAACIHRERNTEFLRNRYGTERYHCAALDDRFVIFSIGQYGRRSACFALEAKRMGPRDWLAFIRYVAAHYRDVDVILRITGRPGKCLPLFRIPRQLLPNKFRIVAKSIGSRTLPENVEFRMDLSDFEVV
jgi:hypothetical protein